MGIPPPLTYEYEVVLKDTMNIITEKSLDKTSYVKVDGKWVSITTSQEVRSNKMMESESKGVVLSQYESGSEGNQNMSSRSEYNDESGENDSDYSAREEDEVSLALKKNDLYDTIRILMQKWKDEGFRGKSAGSQSAIFGEQYKPEECVQHVGFSQQVSEGGSSGSQVGCATNEHVVLGELDRLLGPDSAIGPGRRSGSGDPT
ncbi:hypothetical protein Scep_012137 [Stephania cephalantha]|uniref:Uncharacterized protein n=1 Tax=Stephania cephalantha TaxID=152367 RepID=A0AAP0P770_9MAGN